MAEPLSLLAFAAADGTEAGLAFGSGRVALPDEAAARFAEFDAVELPGISFGDGSTLAAGVTESGVGVLSGDLPAPGAGESLRVAVALFPGGRTLAVAALRPRRAKGHDRDQLDALVVEGGAALLVDDPRFSVALGAGDVPRRVGLELWLAPPEDASDDAPIADYPRRASGEVSGPALPLDADGVSASAHPVSWRSRGETGHGWFVLAEPA